LLKSWAHKELKVVNCFIAVAVVSNRLFMLDVTSWWLLLLTNQAANTDDDDDDDDDACFVLYS